MIERLMGKSKTKYFKLQYIYLMSQINSLLTSRIGHSHKKKGKKKRKSLRSNFGASRESLV